MCVDAYGSCRIDGGIHEGSGWGVKAWRFMVSNASMFMRRMGVGIGNFIIGVMVLIYYGVVYIIMDEYYFFIGGLLLICCLWFLLLIAWIMISVAVERNTYFHAA